MYKYIKDDFADEIVALMHSFSSDNRKDKIDLGVGVYRDEHGSTPIMEAVKTAERQLIKTQITKTYLGMDGDPAFCNSLTNLIFPDLEDLGHYTFAQTPGGAGALRQFADLVHGGNKDSIVWVSNLTWPNHEPIFSASGLEVRTYDYYNMESQEVDLEAMLTSLDQAKPDDIVVLHACCHNPTGADLSADSFRTVATYCSDKGLFPLLDAAYLGLGSGLEEDLLNIRLVAQHCEEFAVAISCSKTFSLYRDRVGMLLCRTKNQREKEATLKALKNLARTSYSMPPDHGAAIVRKILSDEQLKALWLEELQGMRIRINMLRDILADALQHRIQTDRFEAIRHQKGMFSCINVNPEQVQCLREKHAVYMLSNGRINVAGLKEHQVSNFAQMLSEL